MQLSCCVLQTAWRLFWDQQLLKVLDAQFVRDLRTIFNSLPVQHVKLVYADRQVALQPPLEDVRSAFYRTLLDPFLSLPSQVRSIWTQVASPPMPFSNTNLLLYIALQVRRTRNAGLWICPCA